MNRIDKYYNVLGLAPGASINDIKNAYRKCARRYHPDINSSESAVDMFIISTEAYQFLITHQKNLLYNKSMTNQFVNDWERNKREQARRKAYAYSRTRYSNFKNSGMYKSTRVLDKTQLYMSTAVALLIIILAINGYIFRLRMVDEGFEKPTLAGFLFLLFTGLLFLAFSLVFLYHNHYKPSNSIKNEKKNK
ncbi:MAG: J domain-containing protein [Bacteroidales bacterium]|nr:J domain-containing protein [Bacteroidales bacterium]